MQCRNEEKRCGHVVLKRADVEHTCSGMRGAGERLSWHVSKTWVVEVVAVRYLGASARSADRDLAATLNSSRPSAFWCFCVTQAGWAGRDRR